MSGIELVLAVLPLLISVTEHQRDLRRLARSLVSKRERNERLEEFFHDLGVELTLLRLTIRHLISDLPILTLDEKVQLLELNRNQWRNPNVEKALKQRLQGASDGFTNELDRILASLEQLVGDHCLDLDATDVKDETIVYQKLEALRSDIGVAKTGSTLMERLRFTSHEKRRKHYLKRVRDSNKNLERLLQGAVDVTPPRSYMSRGGGPPHTRQRRLSESLYETMMTKMVCKCPTRHEARLCLLNCWASPDIGKSGISLDMFLSYMNDKQGRAWQESNFRFQLEKDAQKVRFEPGDQKSEVRPASDSHRRDIDALLFCDLIKEASRTESSLEIDFESGKMFQTRSKRKQIRICEPDLGVRLTNLLQRREKTIKLRESRILAVILAHAMMHFAESPWLEDTWNKDHISFFVTDHGIDLARPYLSTTFLARPKDAEQQVTLFSFHPSQAILSLGILLLEMQIRRPIESEWDGADLVDGQPNANTNIVTAMRLLQKLRAEVHGENYLRAVRACIECDFVTQDLSPNLDNADFRQEVYNNIVAPLEEELSAGWDVTPEKLKAFETERFLSAGNE